MERRVRSSPVKPQETITQLKAYRNFGASNISLLDVYICEAGFMGHNPFPPTPALQAIRAKMPELKNEGFGYQILPFEHENHGDVDVGLRAFGMRSWYGSPSSSLKLILSVQTTPVDGFPN